MSYAEWIAAYIERTGSGLGRCQSATTEMVAAFPELRRVPGVVYCNWGRREHWWCETANGTVVDPTASQFDFVSEYVPWEPGEEVRVGRCMDCGEDIMARPENLAEPARGVYSTTFCDERCAENMTKAVGW